MPTGTWRARAPALSAGEEGVAELPNEQGDDLLSYENEDKNIQY